MERHIFKLPDIGEGLHEAEVVSWLVPEGAEVRENQDFVEVQTDKAVVEISAPVTGILIEHGAVEGEPVRVGDVLAVFQSQKAAIVQTREEEKQEKVFEQVSIEDSSSAPKAVSTPVRVLAAPSVRKAAREAGVNLSEVEGSGKSGKILMTDLQTYLKPATSKQKNNNLKITETTSDFANDTIEKIKGIRKVTFDRMATATHTAALCTGMDEVNVTRLVEIRHTLNRLSEKKLTYLPFVIKAVTQALKLHPLFNASVDEEKMEIRKYKDIHIGIATATDSGLVVPVIRHADRLSIEALADEIERLSSGARTRDLKPHDLSGSTFTISNTGGQGGFYGTPIVNHPEVAILGIHAVKKKPIIEDDQIVVGSLMGMSLTFDHRVIDGEPSGRFMSEIKLALEQPERFILQSI